MTKKQPKDPDPIKQAEAVYKHNSKMLGKVEPKKKGAPNRPGTLSTRFTPKKQDTYINVMRETGEQALALREVGMWSESIREFRRRTPGFVDREEEAMRIYRAGLAAEVHRRGKDGVQEPIYWNGVIVGWKTVYSDKMLKLQVQRHSPEYRDHHVVENKHSGVIETMADMSKLTPALRAELRAVLEKIQRCTGDGDEDS